MRSIFLVILLMASPALAQMGGSSRTPFLSVVNSTTTPLAAGATFTGEWEQCFHWANISVGINTDLDGTLKMEFSTDKVNVDSSITYILEAGSFEPPHELQVFRRYCRVVVTNDDATATQSYLRLQTIYGQRIVPISPLNLKIDKDSDASVVRAISDELLIALGLLDGYYVELKFGRNADIDTGTLPEDIWGGGGAYTGFPTQTELLEVLSSDAADTLGGAGCEKVQVYGLSAAGVDQNENITLSGVTPVDSTLIYSRVYRVQCIQSANGANTAFNAGTITTRHTTTTANVFSVIPIGASQSQLGCISIPAGKKGFLRHMKVDVNRSTTATVDGGIWIRFPGESPRMIQIFSASQTDGFEDTMFGGIELPALTDLCLRITGASVSNVEVVGHMDIVVIEL